MIKLNVLSWGTQMWGQKQHTHSWNLYGQFCKKLKRDVLPFPSLWNNGQCHGIPDPLGHTLLGAQPHTCLKLQYELTLVEYSMAQLIEVRLTGNRMLGCRWGQILICSQIVGHTGICSGKMRKLFLILQLSGYLPPCLTISLSVSVPIPVSVSVSVPPFLPPSLLYYFAQIYMMQTLLF